jgi:hypothetical protein
VLITTDGAVALDRMSFGRRTVGFRLLEGLELCILGPSGEELAELDIFSDVRRMSIYLYSGLL